MPENEVNTLAMQREYEAKLLEVENVRKALKGDFARNVRGLVIALDDIALRHCINVFRAESSGLDLRTYTGYSAQVHSNQAKNDVWIMRCLGDPQALIDSIRDRGMVGPTFLVGSGRRTLGTALASSVNRKLMLADAVMARKTYDGQALAPCCERADRDPVVLRLTDPKPDDDERDEDPIHYRAIIDKIFADQTKRGVALKDIRVAARKDPLRRSAALDSHVELIRAAEGAVTRSPTDSADKASTWLVEHELAYTIMMKLQQPAHDKSDCLAVIGISRYADDSTPQEVENIATLHATAAACAVLRLTSLGDGPE